MEANFEICHRSVLTRIIQVLVVAAALLFPSAGRCDTKITLKPMVMASTRYDSNFYKAADHERGVFTYLAQPGFQFGVETPKTRLNLFYTLEAYFYDDNEALEPGEDPVSDEDYLGHLVEFDSRYKPTPRLTLGLNDEFYYTRDTRQTDEFDVSVDRRKYYVNRLTPLIFYDFENRFSLGLRYRWTELHYLEGDSGDLTEHRGILNTLYDPTRSTTLDLEYQVWTVDYDQFQSDYVSNQATLIFEKRFKHLAFNLGVGYQNRDYDDADLGSAGVMAYKASVLWQTPPPPEGRRFLGKEFLRARTHFFLGAERNFNNFDSLYTAHRFTASAGHVFWDKIQLKLRAWYQISDYEDDEGFTSDGDLVGREDRSYDAWCRVGYLIRSNMDLSVKAGREERESNIYGLDYADNYALVEFRFNYDIASRGSYSEEAPFY